MKVNVKNIFKNESHNFVRRVVFKMTQKMFLETCILYNLCGIYFVKNCFPIFFFEGCWTESKSFLLVCSLFEFFQETSAYLVPQSSVRLASLYSDPSLCSPHFINSRFPIFWQKFWIFKNCPNFFSDLGFWKGLSRFGTLYLFSSFFPLLLVLGSLICLLSLLFTLQWVCGF